MEDPPYIASDVSQLGKAYVQIVTRLGPQGTGIVETSGWIEVPVARLHQIKTRCVVEAMESWKL